MELELDKEIDALLRQKDFSPAGTRVPDEHLGVDEIAAFAENALPEAGRAVYTRHLAACDDCRKILSAVISLNSEVETLPEASALPAVEPAAARWYRGLFGFPGLAYALGGLIVVLAGFLAFSVVRNSDRSSVADVSQISEQAPVAESGTSASEDQLFPAYPANTADTSANSAANSNSNTAVANVGRSAAANNPSNAAASVTTSLPEEQKRAFKVDGASGSENTFVIDGQETATARPPAPAAAAPVQASKDKAERSELKPSPEFRNLDVSPPVAAQQDMQAREDSKNARAKQAAANAQTKIIAGPSRDMNSQYGNSQIQTLPAPSRRIVSGRNFELRQGVWYDAGYKGQAATNVKRGTETYIRLDAGLRNIADNIGGTVIIVWKGKAYRIQ